MSGTLTPRPTARDLALAGFAETLMQLFVSMVSCAAGSASAAMPRKLASLSTAEGWNDRCDHPLEDVSFSFMRSL
ncbi:hypothetical protein Scep_001142 [Stephania cephalantha]|uniref:Uncharacterized protein n=1 Tax=Stephania cephalantha TaxID=152367 RepID=A0AAP0L7L4_9MAGN